MPSLERVTCNILILTAGLSGLSVAAQQRPSLAELRAGFLAPPPAARLRCYWWWLNGHTDEATITHDLEEMRAKGFGGALLVDAGGADQDGNEQIPAGPTFGSPGWIALYTHALREADRLGLEITLNITSGWNLGGPDVTPEQGAKLLTWTRTEVTGGKQLTIALPAPAIHDGFYRPIAVLAYPLHHGNALPVQPKTPSLKTRSAAAETGRSMPDSTPMLHADMSLPTDTSLTEVRNISTWLGDDGTISWDAPAGDWEVLRIGYTDSDVRVSTGSGAWQGLAIDYLSRDAFDAHWNYAVEPLLQAARPFHSLKYLATDSWELYEKSANWTEAFVQEFQTRRGYDPTPWLPVVAGRIIGDPDQSDRFLTDLRRTVADLVSANLYDVFAERAAKFGLGVQAESGGPHGVPIDALETFRHSAIPQTEFWSPSPHRAMDQDRFFAKEAASAAHIYGQPIVAEEGETSVGPQWSESLATDLKPTFDMGITEGTNRLVWHEFTSSPAATGLPGQEYFAGTHLNPKITWWNSGTAFFNYLNRIQFLMQQGTAVDDLLYFYGDNVPTFVRLKGDDPAHVLPGYDYDVTNEDALLHSIHLEGKHLVGPSGVRWVALAMPTSGRLSLASLQRIEAYVHGGGTLIGLKPASATGMISTSATADFSRTVTSMWGAACIEGSHHAYGSGQIYCTARAHDALLSIGIPQDVALPTGASLALGTSSDSTLDYVHRRVGDSDIYFLRNGSALAVSQDVLFRAQGKSVELWDPLTGEIQRVKEGHLDADGRTSLPLKLSPFGSAVLVFSSNDKGSQSASSFNAYSSQRAVPLQMQHPWSLSFQPERGAPEKAITIDALRDWTTFKEPGIRFFSGTATYRNEIEAPAAAKGNRVWLHFADIREIARVTVNGHDAGTVWAKPLTLRVDPWLKPGANTIVIEVTNLWPNRIIGDLQPGVTGRITQTNITKYKASSSLLPSGLIGPVEWLIEQ